MWNQMLEVDFELDDEPSSSFSKRVTRSADDVCCTCQQGAPGRQDLYLLLIFLGADGPPGLPVRNSDQYLMS
jgi:hypothetical protein